MGLFFGGKRRQQRAAVFTSPPIPPNSQAMPYIDTALPGGAEWSLQAVAMWSAVDLITSLTSELPVDVFRGKGRAREELPAPSYLLDPGGDGYGLEDWLSQYLLSMLLRGNANGRVAGRGPNDTYPTQIVLHHPDCVSGRYDADGHPEWRVNGRPVDAKNMWHRRVHTVPGQLMGLSPVEYQAATIGLQLTSKRFGLEWFASGAHPSGMLTNSETDLSDATVMAKVKAQFLAAVFGTREPLVLGKGWKYESIQISPNESQFLETQGYSAAECARIFGPGVAEVLGYETGKSTLTYATVEGRSTHLLVYALNKWIRRADRVLTGMLPRGQYARLNRSALLQSTALERWRVYQIQLKSKARKINEVRDDEDWGPVDWGEEPVDFTPAGDSGSGGDKGVTG